MKRFLFQMFAAAGMLILLVGGLAGCNETQKNAKAEKAVKKETISIGYQKSGVLCIVKEKGDLDKRLKSLGYKVQWTEFQAGPALMEALNAGSLDFGRTGDSPPIFAQSADVPFYYVGSGKQKPDGSAIFVHKDSPVQSVTELKGKKVAFAKGSSSHIFIVKALEKNGLKYSDIEPVFLPPADARIAFEQGKVDAWVIWDPFSAAAEVAIEPRVLTRATGITGDRDFFLASVKFAEKNPDLLKVMLEEIEKTSQWVNKNPEEVAAFLAPLLGIDQEAMELAVKRRDYGVEEMSREIIEEQQRNADTFFELKVIPKKVVTKDTVFKSVQ